MFKKKNMDIGDDEILKTLPPWSPLDPSSGMSLTFLKASRQAMIFIMGSCLTERSTPSEAALLWKGERQKGPAVELQISNAESSRFDKASCHSEDEPLDGCWRRDEDV